MSTIRNFHNATTEQHEQLLNWFFYRITPDQRRALSEALPAAYNAFIGRNAVKVVTNV